MGREHWLETGLENCIDILDSKRIPLNSEERQKIKGQIPYYGATGVVDLISKYLFDEELLLLGEDGAPFFDRSKSISFLINGKSWVNNHAHVLRANGASSNSFLMYFLNQFDFHGYVNGTTRLKLTQEKMRKIPLLLPPLNEQKRIVARLDALLSKVRSAQARLAKIPGILKKFRQSVLAAACSGRLTEDWREGKDLSCVSESGDLPDGWQWIELEKVIPKGGMFDGPFGSNLKTSDYTTSGIRVIRLENIGHLSFFSEKETFISPKKYSTLIKHTVGEGDVIFSSFITDEIRACILPPLDCKAIAKADCFTLRLNNEDLIMKKYLLYQLVCRESFEQLTENIHGVSRPRINTKQLRQLKIRLCPLEEQHEIVRRVEQLFALADSLAAKYHKARARVEKLEQALLAKAFRGELAPPDPHDEPADVLLQRILAEKATLEARQKPKKKKYSGR